MTAGLSISKSGRHHQAELAKIMSLAAKLRAEFFCPHCNAGLIDPLITTGIAAFILGLDPHTLENDRLSGRLGLPFFKGKGRNGAVRYSLAVTLAHRDGSIRHTTSTPERT